MSQSQDDSEPRSIVSPFARLADAWLSTTDQVVTGVVDANRRLLSQYGVESDVRTAPALPSLYYSEGRWAFERSVDSPEHVSVGDTVEFTKRLVDDDVQAFAEASGDTNRLHLDDDFAAETRFDRRIVHGTLISGVISAALARLPGLVIYLSQDVQFLEAVDVGDTVTATVEVVEDLGDERYELTTVVHDSDGTKVVDGRAVVLIDDLPGEESGAR